MDSSLVWVMMVYSQPLKRLQRMLKRCPLELETRFRVVQPTLRL